jgi:hypothetical protein
MSSRAAIVDSGFVLDLFAQVMAMTSCEKSVISMIKVQIMISILAVYDSITCC